MNHDEAPHPILRLANLRWAAFGCIAVAMTACANETGKPYKSMAGRPVTDMTDKAGPPDWSRTYPDGSKDIKYEYIDASTARAIAPRCSATFVVSKDDRIQGQMVTGSQQDCIYLRYRLGL
jgi:hypothetical protein